MRKSRKSTSRSRRSGRSRKERQSRHRKQHTAPKTMKLPSKRSGDVPRKKASRAHTGMRLTDLQFMAKSLGIPFGALDKDALIRKINNYK